VTAAYFLGIDGGGTNCRARVRDADGRLIGEATGGPSNIATDPVEAIANIAKVSEAALLKGGLPASRLAQCSACFGLAGANMAGASERVLSHSWPFRKLRLEHDGIIACVGAHAGEYGAIASIGTGAVYVVSIGGKLQTFGGWGFVLSDQGSGADLGREALRRSLYARDGLIERRQSATDRRVTINTITPKGTTVIRDIMAITNELRAELLDDIEPEKLATTIETLSLILRRLDEMR